MAAYCWLGVSVEKGPTSSQDVASLPPLGAPSLLTSYLFVFVKATFPEPGLQLVLFFLYCLRRSQLEGQENWSGKALLVCHRWLRAGPGLRLLLAARRLYRLAGAEDWAALSQGGETVLALIASRSCFCVAGQSSCESAAALWALPVEEREEALPGSLRCPQHFQT